MAAKKGHGDCKACGAKCCRYIVVEIDKPKGKADRDEIQWLLAHENVEVFRDNSDRTWNLQVHTDCTNLDANHRCRIYDDRFQVCRDYEEKTCEASDAELDVLMFRTTEEFDAWWAKKKTKKEKKRRRGKKKRRREKRKAKRRKKADRRKAKRKKKRKKGPAKA